MGATLQRILTILSLAGGALPAGNAVPEGTPTWARIGIAVSAVATALMLNRDLVLGKKR